MKEIFNEIPGQVKRLLIIFVLFIVTLITAKTLLVPEDFGKYGNFRGNAIIDEANKDVKYAGQVLCVECHEDIGAEKFSSFHKNISCEVCHGPGAAHTEDDEIELAKPNGRKFCLMCHEYLPSRPTGFPQIVSKEHSPRKVCIKCHNPHDPKPPETPEHCEACHRTIGMTKSLSHHADIECTFCHNTPKEHRINPRSKLPSKPATREFCGGCHAQGSDADISIPKIDIDTHEKRYVCWQCHYPHLPEAN